MFCLSFIDLRLLITPWYLLYYVLSVLHWFTWRTDKTMDKAYQGVIRRRKSMKDRQSNGQSIPRGNKSIFCTMFCLSFIDLRLLITPWYLLYYVLSVLHWFTSSYYLLVSFVLCFFCPYKTMDKRYQEVIRRRKSMKDRQNNGQSIPRGNKKT
jgi:nicotinamide riboside transporter PnuC